MQTVLDPTIDLFPRAAARGCFSAVTAEDAEWVRVGADRVRLAAGRCCSPNTSGQSDSSADQYFRDHVVPRDDAVVSFGYLWIPLDTYVDAPAVRMGFTRPTDFDTVAAQSVHGATCPRRPALSQRVTSLSAAELQRTVSQSSTDAHMQRMSYAHRNQHLNRGTRIRNIPIRCFDGSTTA
jgi:hypothetical protein